MAFLALTLAVMLIGVVLLRQGLRGRRVGDHPLCRWCGYDLTGKPEASTRCAECGADLHAGGAIVVGHQERRYRPLVAGVFLCLIVLLVGVGSFVPAIREFDPTPYKPAWLLIRELRSGSPAVQLAAVRELDRRLADGMLGRSSIEAAVNHLLAVQADASISWDQSFSQFIEATRVAGRLSDEHWARYAVQGLDISLFARPSARQGDPMPLQIRVSRGRLGEKTYLLAKYEWEHLHSAGHELAVPSRRDTGISVKGTSVSWSSPTLGPEESLTSQLAPGFHEASGVLRLEFWGMDPDEHPGIGNYPDAPPIAVDVRELSTSYEILPADTPVTFSFVDDVLRREVQNAVTVTGVEMRPPRHLHMLIKINEAPVRFVGDIVLRMRDGTEFEAYTWIDYQAGANHSYSMGRAFEIGDAAEVDVVLVPHPDRVRRSLDPAPTWGEEIIIRGVPIGRPQGD